MSKWTGKGEPPYGFEINFNGTVFKSHVEQAVLETVWEMQAKDKALAMIAENLNGREFETRKGRRWNRHSVRRALQNYEKGSQFQDLAVF